MATDDKIVAKFTADISEYKAKLVELEGQLNKLSDTQKDTATEQKKTSAELASASNKRKLALQNEQAELKRLQASLKAAFTVKDIETFNQKIAQTKQNISTLKGEASGISKAVGGLGGQFAALGAGIAAAFSVQAVIQFGEASIKAFLEADENAQRLKNSLREVGQEGEVAFERLIKQSEKLAQTGKTIFSDDDIQRAQAQLANFGLTAREIELLIPKLADYASATKQNIVDASAKVGQALLGQGREFKKYGIFVDATKTSTENLNVVMDGFIQFQGRAAKETETLTGQLADQRREVDELEESLGQRLAPAFVGAKRAALDFVNSILNVFSISGQIKTTLRDLGVSASESLQIIEAAGNRLNSSKAGVKAIKEYQTLAQAVDFFNEKLKDSKQPQIDYLNAVQGLNTLIQSQNTQTKEGQIGQKLLQNGLKELAQTYKLVNPEIKEFVDLSKKSTEELIRLKETSDDRDFVILIGRELEARKKLEAQKAAAAKAEQEQAEKIKKLLEEQIKLNEELQSVAVKNELRRNQDIIDFGKELSSAQGDRNKEVQQQADEQVQINNEKNKAIAEADREAREKTIQADKELADKKKKLNDQIQQEALNLANQIADAVFAVQRNNLQRQQDAETQALETQKEKALSSKRLTDAERDKLNKDFATKERALARKQFEESKRLSLAEAIIKGALAVVEALASSVGYPYNLVLAAAAAAATAVEIATITATKYAKGTKDAKGGMSLVGEDGAEFMYVPQHAKILTAKQTKQHSKVIDAIYDNRLEKLIYHDHVLPALERQKANFNKRKEQSFADSLSKSLIFQGLTGKEMDKIRRKGTSITNTDELAEKIAAIISKGYDRRRQV